MSISKADQGERLHGLDALRAGALLLGVNGICVVSHGKSDAFAIKNALLVAERAVKGRVVEHVRNTCRELFPETSVPA